MQTIIISGSVQGTFDMATTQVPGTAYRACGTAYRAGGTAYRAGGTAIMRALAIAMRCLACCLASSAGWRHPRGGRNGHHDWWRVACGGSIRGEHQQRQHTCICDLGPVFSKFAGKSVACIGNRCGHSWMAAFTLASATHGLCKWLLACC